MAAKSAAEKGIESVKANAAGAAVVGLGILAMLRLRARARRSEL